MSLQGGGKLLQTNFASKEKAKIKGKNVFPSLLLAFGDQLPLL
jgi:hypothetical protein